MSGEDESPCTRPGKREVGISKEQGSGHDGSRRKGEEDLRTCCWELGVKSPLIFFERGNARLYFFIILG